MCVAWPHCARWAPLLPHPHILQAGQGLPFRQGQAERGVPPLRDGLARGRTQAPGRVPGFRGTFFTGRITGFGVPCPMSREWPLTRRVRLPGACGGGGRLSARESLPWTACLPDLCPSRRAPVRLPHQAQHCPKPRGQCGPHSSRPQAQGHGPRARPGRCGTPGTASCPQRSKRAAEARRPCRSAHPAPPPPGRRPDTRQAPHPVSKSLSWRVSLLRSSPGDRDSARQLRSALGEHPGDIWALSPSPSPAAEQPKGGGCLGLRRAPTSLPGQPPRPGLGLGLGVNWLSRSALGQRAGPELSAPLAWGQEPRGGPGPSRVRATPLRVHRRGLGLACSFRRPGGEEAVRPCTRASRVTCSLPCGLLWWARRALPARGRCPLGGDRTGRRR